MKIRKKNVQHGIKLAMRARAETISSQRKVFLHGVEALVVFLEL
jgi:hypothetical protein